MEDRSDRVEELERVWGPPPSDPYRLSTWKRGLELMADLPHVVADLVESEGTYHPSLHPVFGEQFLPRLEADVVWRLLLIRKIEDTRDAALDVLGDPLWSAMLHGHSPVLRSRLTSRLAEDVNDNLMAVLLRNPIYRAWLTDFDERR